MSKSQESLIIRTILPTEALAHEVWPKCLCIFIL